MEDFRKELDELLGKDRNLAKSERMQKKDHFDDEEVCKYFLVAFCPHELFINTRNDIGRCKKRHDSFFKQQYLSDPNKLYYQKKYEQELLTLLEQLVSSVDARIRRSLARLEVPLRETDDTMENQDKKNALNALIDRRMKEAEQLAEAGRVNESEALIKEIEQLKERNEDQEAMICEICGAMQSSTDTDRRQISHLEGKQHKGFATIRKCIEELKSHKDMYRHIDINKPPPKRWEAKSDSRKRTRT